MSAALTSYFENLSFVHDFQYNFDYVNGVDTSFVNRHSISMNGSLPLSENWKLNIGNIGYDIKNNGLNYPTLKSV